MNKISFATINLFFIVVFIGHTITAQKAGTKSEYKSFYRYIPEKMTWNEHKKLAVELWVVISHAYPMLMRMNK